MSNSSASLLQSMLTRWANRSVTLECPLCGCADARNTISKDDHKSLEEFEISGLCAQCQDEVFAAA